MFASLVGLDLIFMKKRLRRSGMIDVLAKRTVSEENKKKSQEESVLVHNESRIMTRLSDPTAIDGSGTDDG